jgi:hypothetical protein
MLPRGYLSGKLTTVALPTLFVLALCLIGLSINGLVIGLRRGDERGDFLILFSTYCLLMGGLVLASALQYFQQKRTAARGAAEHPLYESMSWTSAAPEWARIVSCACGTAAPGRALTCSPCSFDVLRATRRLSRRLWLLVAVQILGSVPLVYGIFGRPTFQGLILLLSMIAFLTVTTRGAVSIARFAGRNGLV